MTVSPTRAERRARRRVLPFSLHQAGELFLAVLLIVVGLHTSRGSELALLAGGAVLVALCVLTDGALSAWRLMSRAGHKRADWLGMAALALLPLVPGRTLLSSVLLEGSAVALWRLAAYTRFEPRPSRRRILPARSVPTAASGSVPTAASGSVPTTASGPRPTPTAALPPAADLALRRTARKAGLAAGIIRRRGLSRREP